LDLKQANVKVSIIDSGAGAHGTASSLLPVGVTKLEDVTPHNFGQGFNYKVHGHAFG
jgi:hypothetical protein